MSKMPQSYRLFLQGVPLLQGLFTADELEVAVALQRETTRRASRANDRRVLIYGVFSLGGAILMAILWLAWHLNLWNSRQRANVLLTLGDLWNSVYDNILLVSVLFRSSVV